MDNSKSRRAIMRAIGTASVAALALRVGSYPVLAASETAAQPIRDYLRPEATRLRRLAQELAAIPRRRSFKALPMILLQPEQWDNEALNTVVAYDGPRQVFDTTHLAGGWINQIRNTLNAQVFSLLQANFLIAAAPHGGAALALFSQPMWDKYKLAEQTSGAFKSNTFLNDPEFPASAANEPGRGLYTDAGNFVLTLQKRGVVFLGCHNAIWELAGTLIKAGINPDRASQQEIAADLTNNLAPGVIATPGNEAMIGKLQETGFVYAAS
jgi:hypothetical protein